MVDTERFQVPLISITRVGRQLLLANGLTVGSGRKSAQLAYLLDSMSVNISTIVGREASKTSNLQYAQCWTPSGSPKIGLDVLLGYNVFDA